MKIKSLIFIALTAFLCTLANAQVRQIFKIIDYSTGKPLAGATLECCGQKLTTNANGVAVFSSKKHKYGDCAMVESVKLPGYSFCCKDWKTMKSDIFRKDTFVYYMTDGQRFEKEAEALFDSLFMYNYRTKTFPSISEVASLAGLGFYSAEEVASDIMTTSFIGDVVDKFYDATFICPLSMGFIDNDVRKDCEKLLLSGDLQGCLQQAQQQIADNDNSDKNLQRIAYFLRIKNATDDSTPVSNYYKTLYDNKIQNRYFARKYYYSLMDEGKRKEAEDFRQSFIAKSKDPHISFNLTYNDLDSFNTNPEAYIEKNMTKIKTARQLLADKPDELSWLYAVTASMHLFNGDTAKAELYIDTAFAELLKDSPDAYRDEMEYKLSILRTISIMPVDAIAGATSDKVNDFRLKLVRDIYNANPNSLFGRLVYLDCIKRIASSNDSLQFEFLPTIDALSQSLVDELPRTIAPNMLHNKILLILQAIQSQETPGEMLQKLADYREVYYKCNKLYPNIFSQHCIGANSYLKLFSYKTENDFLAEAIDVFNEELLAQIHSYDNDADSLLVRGDYYNSEAEKLYHDELYRQSMQSYDKAAKYYSMAAASDPSGTAHIKLCNNSLQKGDAYFNLKRYNEATDCYQQVFDYEKQIPQPAKPRYTAKKGQAYHFEGDMMLAKEEYKKAYKLFDKAEKEFKKAEKMGDSTLYGHWAELHISIAVAFAKQEKADKTIEELENAERLYQTKPMNYVSLKYENIKSTLLKYYSENKNWDKYLVCKSTFHQYLDSAKYTDIEHFDEYVNSAMQLGDLWSGIGVPGVSLQYYKEAKQGNEFLIQQGYSEPDEQYYELSCTVARYYRYCDSINRALEQLAECEKLNSLIYADTAPETALINDLNLKSQTALCYEDMAKTDTLHTDQLYKDALPLYTHIINTLSDMDNDISLQRNLGQFHRRIASVHLNLDHYYSADKHFDTALAVMMPLYNGGYKQYVEDDVARDYLGKAIIYQSSDDYDNPDKAKQMLEACIDICQKAENSNNMTNLESYAVNIILKMLENNPQSTNEAEIKKYRKLQAELEKKLEKQK